VEIDINTLRMQSKREEKGMTQKELGIKIGYTEKGAKSAVYKIERGQKRLYFDTFMKICLILEEDPVKLINVYK